MSQQKLSKEEIIALKKKKAELALIEKARVEEEKRKQEEEERKKQEELEKLRIVNEIKRQDEIKLSLQGEADRLKQQTYEHIENQKIRNNFISTIFNEIKLKEDWDEYINCSPLPKPNSDSELNTYLAIYKEEKINSINDLVNGLQLCEDIVKSIENMNIPSNKIEYYQNIIQQYRDIAAYKIDKMVTSSSLIQNAEIIEDGKMNENLDQCSSNDLRFGMWVRSTPSGQNGARFKQIAFKELNITIELPKALATYSSGGSCTTIAFRVLNTNYDPYQFKNKGSYVAIGGVFSLEFLGVPPAPSKARDWTVREISELTEKCVIKPYPGLTESVAQTIRISYPLPRQLVINEEQFQLAYFDEKECTWKNDGSISDAKYNSSDHSVSFSILAHKLNPIAVVQPRSIDLPYRKWSIKPTSTNSLLFNIETLRMDLQIEISDNYCMLVQPTLPILADILNKPMAPALLIKNLFRYGINLSPNKKDAEIIGLVNKNSVLENKIYNEISQIVPNYDISSSILNTYSGHDASYLQIKTSDLRSEISPWMTVYVTILKAMILKSQFTVGTAPVPPEQLKIETQVSDNSAAKPEESETNVDLQPIAVPAQVVEDPKKKIIGEDNLITPDNFQNLFSFDHFEQSNHTIFKSVEDAAFLKGESDIQPNLKLQETLCQLLNLVRPISFEKL